jgi:hypothetical protein
LAVHSFRYSGRIAAKKTLYCNCWSLALIPPPESGARSVARTLTNWARGDKSVPMRNRFRLTRLRLRAPMAPLLVRPPSDSQSMRLLICVVFAIALVSSSLANAAPSIGDDGRSTTTKPPGEMLVAQAWWDAAYNATTAQRQTPTQQGGPSVRSESRWYNDSSQTHGRPRRP